VRVLIVEDQSDVAQELAGGLGDQGFQAVTARDGRSALDRYSDVDVVLLDLGLPDRDGFDVCRAIRADSNVPIIMVSGRSDEFDRVLGLKLGADDYVVKPVWLRELAARIEAVVRRTTGARERPRAGDLPEIGPLRIDPHGRRVTVHGREVSLTRKEFDLLALLAAEPDRVLGRAAIMRAVWGHDGAGDTRTLGVHIASLRKKLGLPRLVETVRGVGFRLNCPA
jgi:two-component system, OmpR family, response regulator RegX3